MTAQQGEEDSLLPKPLIDYDPQQNTTAWLPARPGNPGTTAAGLDWSRMDLVADETELLMRGPDGATVGELLDDLMRMGRKDTDPGELQRQLRGRGAFRQYATVEELGNSLDDSGAERELSRAELVEKYGTRVMPAPPVTDPN